MSQHPDDRPTFQELEKQLREFLIPLIQSTISVRHDYLLEMIKIRDILGCLSTDNHCKSFNHHTTTRNK
jgi:hypothetical protein